MEYKNKIVMIGGYTSLQSAIIRHKTLKITAAVEEFDGNSWFQLADLPIPIAYSTAVTIGEKIFVFGKNFGHIFHEMKFFSILRLK